MATPKAKIMDLGDAVINAAARISVNAPPPTPEVCKTMHETILAGMHHSFVIDLQTLWTYFSTRLRSPRNEEVKEATRKLLKCKLFNAHVQSIDYRIRPLLCAGAMIQAPAEEAYWLIVNTSDFAGNVSDSCKHLFPSISRRHPR